MNEVINPMSRSRMAAIAALLVLTAVIGGTVINSVAAATSPRAATTDAIAPAAPPASPEAANATPSAACAEFRAAFAAALGVDASALTPAAKTAARQVVDAALAAGRITAARADKLKARIDKAAGDGCGVLAGRSAARATLAAGALRVVRDGIDAAAGALKLNRADLVAKIRGGETLQAIAADAGVPYATVTSAVIAAVKQDLAEAVAKGTIRQARADRILERLRQNLAAGRFRAAKPAAPVAPAASQPAGS
jgi:hypothetical protein